MSFLKLKFSSLRALFFLSRYFSCLIFCKKIHSYTLQNVEIAANIFSKFSDFLEHRLLIGVQLLDLEGHSWSLFRTSGTEENSVSSFSWNLDFCLNLNPLTRFRYQKAVIPKVFRGLLRHFFNVFPICSRNKQFHQNFVKLNKEAQFKTNSRPPTAFTSFQASHCWWYFFNRPHLSKNKIVLQVNFRIFISTFPSTFFYPAKISN